MNALKEEYSRINSAISRIRTDHQTALDRLAEIDKRFPHTLAAVALQEAEPEALDALRSERSR